MAAASPYHCIIAAGNALVNRECLAFDPPRDPDAVAAFLAANGPALDDARQALRGDCRVPVEYDQGFFARHVGDFQPLRDLARGFVVELETARDRGELSRAVRVGVDLLDLANATRRGGLITDLLVSVGIAAVGLDYLGPLCPLLSPADRHVLILELARVDQQREPFHEVAARDRDWEARVGYQEEACDPTEVPLMDPEECGLDEAARRELLTAMQDFVNLPDDDRQAFQEQLDGQNLADLRRLRADLARSPE